MIPGIVAGGFRPSAPSLPAPSNLRYWFAADTGAFSDAGTTPAVNYDGVHTWLNQGAASDVGVQTASGNRPVFKTGGLNGKPYLECNGSSHWFEDLIEGDQPSGLTSFNEFTVFFVCDQVPTASHFLLGSAQVASTTSAKCAVWFRDNSGVQDYAWHKNGVSTAVPVANGANVLAGKKRTSNNGHFGRGDQGTAMTNFTQTSNPSSSATTGMRFLRHGSTPGSFFSGRLYELIWYNHDLPNSDCDDVIAYLKAKYAIT
jgi:hypothetical protein